MLKTNTFALPINQKGRFFSLCLVLSSLLLVHCTPDSKVTQEVATTSPGASDSTGSPPGEQKPSSIVGRIIQYTGATQDANKKALETFSPFAPVQALASRAISIQDSLEIAREMQPLTDSKDSLIFMPHVSRAYQAILAYQQQMATGPTLPAYCPSLIQLERSPEPADSSFKVLPTAGKSNLLAHGKFFFLGGAPFISNSRNDSSYTDAQGKPEKHFESSVTENGSFLLSSLYHAKNTPTTISFGPPLSSYDSGPQEVNGIGSLIHTFVNRIPVFFLTEAGLVPAHLISITVKLVPENLGCESDQPQIEFACVKNLEKDEILGVYIPYNSKPLTSCKISRQGSSLWTADLNDDGIADIAGVSDTFAGIISDSMAEVLWFVNINGAWKVIDWAQELDCT